MSKYIDKEVLLERMNRTRPYEGADGSFERYRRLQWLADIWQVNMCPAADVEEVVRCKDCINWKDSFPWTTCSFLDGHWEEDMYCSYGERKDG